MPKTSSRFTALLVAVALAALLPDAAVAKGGPSSATPAHRALAAVRRLAPAGEPLTLIGHVTPRAPIDGRPGYEVGLQLGRGNDPAASSADELRWDPRNQRLTLPANRHLDGNLLVGPYAGLLFTIRAGKSYVVACAGGTDAHLVWRLGLGAAGPEQTGHTDLHGGIVAFRMTPIAGPGGYADLRFAFDTATTLSECWLFSRNEVAIPRPPAVD